MLHQYPIVHLSPRINVPIYTCALATVIFAGPLALSFCSFRGNICPSDFSDVIIIARPITRGNCDSAIGTPAQLPSCLFLCLVVSSMWPDILLVSASPRIAGVRELWSPRSIRSPASVVVYRGYLFLLYQDYQLSVYGVTLGQPPSPKPTRS